MIQNIISCINAFNHLIFNGRDKNSCVRACAYSFVLDLILYFSWGRGIFSLGSYGVNVRSVM